VGVVTHKYVSAIADGGDATLVRPSNWNDQHSIGDVTGTLVVTDAEWINLVRVTLSGTDRVTLAGTARAYIFGWTDDVSPNVVGRPKYYRSAPFRVPDLYEFIVVNRLTMELGARGILEGGNSDMIISDDFGTRSRIVLAGRG
jgi:hypothetical protein